MSRRLIVEVGCGYHPWVVIQSLCRLRPEEYIPHRTPVMDAYADVRSGDRFLCIDSDAECIKEADKNAKGLKKELGAVGPSPIEFLVGDGTKLPLVDGTADAVILQNVLSAPTPGTIPWGSMTRAPYPMEDCIDSTAKLQMVREALRILKKGGALIVGITLTPCYAEETMTRIQKELVDEKRVTLLKQCGRFVPDSDNWHLYHAVFQKEPGPAAASVEVTPWTLDQETYIERYAASWLTWY